MARPKGYVTRQAKRLSDGEINRRRFVMSALSAGVTMPTALSLASRAEAKVPKRGGTLRMALADGTPGDTLDPARAENAFTRLLAFAQGNTLTEVTATGDVIGELAESFERSPDARRWVFTLRPDVRFHDGLELTADDVIATFARPEHRTRFPELEEVTNPAPHVLVMRLSRPDEDFARRLADPSLVILRDGPSPERPIGTGPYRLESFIAGKSADLTRNPSYWKAGRAHFDAVRMISITDDTTRQTALMTGEVDYADLLDPRGVALLQREPTLSIAETAAGRHLALTVQPKIAPFDNPDLREALANVIPGQSLVERLLLGHGQAPGPAPDLDRAARLFRRSGQTAPVPLTASADPVAREAARLIAASAAKAGIPVTIVDEDRGWRTEIRRGDTSVAAENGTVLLLNDISGHAASLTHSGNIAGNHENDGARLTERWWFA